MKCTRFLASCLLLPVASPTPAAEITTLYRHGYDGHADGATPPSDLSQERVVKWKAEVPSWSNASPLVVGDLVCIAVEPAELRCHDAATGELRWRDQVDPLQGMDAAQQADWAPKRDAANAALRGLPEARTRYSFLRRALRRGDPDGSITAELTTLGGQIERWNDAVDQGAPVLTHRDLEMVGYTSHSPTSDGTHVYALLGAGVAAAWTLDGTRMWTKWMGQPEGKPRGYDKGWAASPVIADDLLLVPWGPLRGLDLRTGTQRWASVDIRDYGSPAVATIGSTTVAILPTGQLIRASDGQVLQEEVTNFLYVGPMVRDDLVVGFGLSPDKKDRVEAWRLSETSPGHVKATRTWSHDYPTNERAYFPPTWVDGTIWALTAKGKLHRYDAKTGVEQPTVTRENHSLYVQPTWAAHGVLMSVHPGTLQWVAPHDPLTPLSSIEVGQHRATPTLRDNQMFVRTLDALWCLEAP